MAADGDLFLRAIQPVADGDLQLRQVVVALRGDDGIGLGAQQRGGALGEGSRCARAMADDAEEDVLAGGFGAAVGRVRDRDIVARHLDGPARGIGRHGQVQHIARQDDVAIVEIVDLAIRIGQDCMAATGPGESVIARRTVDARRTAGDHGIDRAAGSRRRREIHGVAVASRQIILCPGNDADNRAVIPREGVHGRRVTGESGAVQFPIGGPARSVTDETRGLVGGFRHQVDERETAGIGCHIGDVEVDDRRIIDRRDVGELQRARRVAANAVGGDKGDGGHGAAIVDVGNEDIVAIRVDADRADAADRRRLAGIVGCRVAGNGEAADRDRIAVGIGCAGQHVARHGRALGDGHGRAGRRQDRRIVGRECAEVEVGCQRCGVGAIRIETGHAGQRENTQIADVFVVGVEAVIGVGALENVEQAVAVGVGRAGQAGCLAIAALVDVEIAVAVAVAVQEVRKTVAVGVDGSEAFARAGRAFIGVVEAVAIGIDARGRGVVRRALRLDIVGDAVIVGIEVEAGRRTVSAEHVGERKCGNPVERVADGHQIRAVGIEEQAGRLIILTPDGKGANLRPRRPDIERCRQCVGKDGIRRGADDIDARTIGIEGETGNVQFVGGESRRCAFERHAARDVKGRRERVLEDHVLPEARNIHPHAVVAEPDRRGAQFFGSDAERAIKCNRPGRKVEGVFERILMHGIRSISNNIHTETIAAERNVGGICILCNYAVTALVRYSITRLVGGCEAVLMNLVALAADHEHGHAVVREIQAVHIVVLQCDRRASVESRRRDAIDILHGVENAVIVVVNVGCVIHAVAVGVEDGAHGGAGHLPRGIGDLVLNGFSSG